MSIRTSAGRSRIPRPETSRTNSVKFIFNDIQDSWGGAERREYSKEADDERQKDEQKQGLRG